MYKVKHGWVLKDVEDNTFVSPGMVNGSKLHDAYVYPTRHRARVCKLSMDRIYKVSLYENGRPKKIIGRG